MASGRALATGLVALWIVAGCTGPAAPASSPGSSSPASPEPTTAPSPSASAAAPSTALAEPCAAPRGRVDRGPLDDRRHGADRAHAPVGTAGRVAGTTRHCAPRLRRLRHGARADLGALRRGRRARLDRDLSGGRGPAASLGLRPARSSATPRTSRSFGRSSTTSSRRAACDAERVVVTGISQGGWLADMAGCEMTDVVAGVVSVASRDFGWPCEPASPVAVRRRQRRPGRRPPVGRWPGQRPAADHVGRLGGRLARGARRRFGRAPALPAETRQSPHVVASTWPGCAAPVTLYRVEDGGHSWPGGGGFPPVNHELSVTEIIAGMLDGTP